MSQLLTVGDIDRGVLATRKVGVIGYGSQGRAQALNLRDSGVDVRIGLRPGSPTAKQAQEDGVRVTTVAGAAVEADVVVLLIPDTEQPAVFADEICAALRPDDLVLFAHGFNIRYGRLLPPSDVDVAMVAPKAPGHAVRATYTAGRGVPCLAAVHQDVTGDAWHITGAYADAIGGGRAGILRTTFAEETETDLFGEQAVLVGGLTGLIRTSFEVLVEAGYQPESAYFECVHELKLVVDLVHEHGLAGMREFISDTAEFGDYVVASRPIWAEVRRHMAVLLDGIRDGTFAEQWVAEDRNGRPTFRAARAAAEQHPLEAVGRTLRELMPESPRRA